MQTVQLSQLLGRGRSQPVQSELQTSTSTDIARAYIAGSRSLLPGRALQTWPCFKIRQTTMHAQHNLRRQTLIRHVGMLHLAFAWQAWQLTCTACDWEASSSPCVPGTVRAYSMGTSSPAQSHQTCLVALHLRALRVSEEW